MQMFNAITKKVTATQSADKLSRFPTKQGAL